MIGNMDEPEDWNATALCLRAGVNAHGQDSHGFLSGHSVGFLMGYLEGQRDAKSGVYDSRSAYLRVKDAAGATA